MLLIEGERVLLRDWRSGEGDAMHRWRGDPDVMRFLSWGSRNRQESEAHLEACLSEQARSDRETYFLAIELRPEARVVGSVGVHWRSRKYGGGEGGLGYFLEPDCWGRGIATEAAMLLVDYGFRTLGMSKISASCDAGNTSSERVMQKLGMQREAEFRHAHQRFGEWRTRLWYGLLREEWEESRTR